MVMRLVFEPERVEERLEAVIARVTTDVGRCLWIIGPGTRPADLGQRLMARGFTVAMEFDGLVLVDLAIDIARNPDVVIEPLSWENAAEYATRCTDSTNPRFHEYLLASAQRYVQAASHEVQIYVARLGGEVAGYAVLRIEPTGLAYFPAELTVKAFRRRGVYLSLVAHRLAVARSAGCTAAVIGAQTATAAPILTRRGFRPVCHLLALAPPRKDCASSSEAVQTQ
jgi:GNAT superfamily N-acetyltransferase